MSSKGMTLKHFLLQHQVKGNDAEFQSLMAHIALVAKVISKELRRAGLADILGVTGEVNIQGEAVKKLDQLANDTFAQIMGDSASVCMLGSEEMDEPLIFPLDGAGGKYVLLIDPLDGSSNIDVNGTLGSIFSVFAAADPTRPDPSSDILRKGTDQVAAGYIIYGPSTMLVFSLGSGVFGFTLEIDSDEFLLSHEDIQIPRKGKTYSVNQGNSEDWMLEVKRYVDYLQQKDVATGRPYALRYVGTMVADIHRTLLEGGIFLYPAGEKHPQGKLRLLYEVSPMAFVLENAGGAATQGTQRILDIQPTGLHQRIPAFMGSLEDVEKAQEFIKAGI